MAADDRTSFEDGIFYMDGAGRAEEISVATLALWWQQELIDPVLLCVAAPPDNQFCPLDQHHAIMAAVHAELGIVIPEPEPEPAGDALNDTSDKSLVPVAGAPVPPLVAVFPFALRDRVRVRCDLANTAIRYSAASAEMRQSPLLPADAPADGTIWMMEVDGGTITVVFDKGAIVTLRCEEGGVWNGIEKLARADDVAPELQAGGATLLTSGSRAMDGLLLGNMAPIGPHRWRVMYSLKSIKPGKGNGRLLHDFDSGAAINGHDFPPCLEPHAACWIEGQLDATQVRRFVIGVTGEEYEHLHPCRFMAKGKKKTSTTEAQPAGLVFSKSDRPPVDPAIFAPGSEWYNSKLVPYLNSNAPGPVYHGMNC